MVMALKYNVMIKHFNDTKIEQFDNSMPIYSQLNKLKGI